MQPKELSHMGRLLHKALKFAQGLVQEAERLGMQVPKKRRRKRVEVTERAPRKRGAKTPLKKTAEEG